VTRFVLRANGALDVAAGVLLLLTTWDRLYSALDLPNPGVAIYAQLGGAFGLSMGYLLWIAPREAALARPVAAAAALTNVVLALVAAAWIAESRAELAGHHTLVLLICIPLLLVVAALEARVAGRAARIPVLSE